MNNNKLKDENSSLSDQNNTIQDEISRLQGVNHELRCDVTRLSIENCTLLEEVAELRNCASVVERRMNELEQHSEAAQNTEEVLTENMEQYV